MKIAIKPIFFSLCAFSSSALASGYAIIEHSASGLAQSFAGAAAVADDASTIYFNPAGMMYVKDNQVSAGLHLIKPSAKFNNNSSSASLGKQIPVNLDSNTGSDAGDLNFVPNFYYLRKFGNNHRFGLGINAPVGLSTEYNEYWMGRYTSTSSDLKSMNINPSIAFNIRDNIQLGFGLSAQYIEASLNKKTFLCGHPQLFSNCNPMDSFQVLASDAHTQMKGDDWSFGYNAGLIYAPSESTRLGLSYRSQVKHTLEGKLTVKTPAGYTIMNQTIQSKVRLPETLSLSVTQQLNQKLTLLADITLTGWNAFQQLRIDTKGGVADITEEKWSDSLRYALGMKYQLNPDVILRSGIALDKTPIDDMYRTSRIPGDNRFWFSMGSSIKLSASLSLDVGYAHLWVSDARINEQFDGLNGAMQGTLQGEYHAHVDILSAQINWNF